MRAFNLLLCASALSAQSPAIRWLGDPPASGGIQWLVVVPAGAADTVIGRFDGAPVVFNRAGDVWTALAPVRIESRDVARATVTVHRGRQRVEVTEQLPVAGRTFRQSHLSVDPQFTTTPTGALAERIARERELAAGLGAAALATPRLFEEAFVAPRADRITSEFGVGRTFNGEVRSRHYGVDFDGNLGDDVRAANRGVVMLVGDFYYSGQIVYVNHGAGLITAYLHMSEVLVSEGDAVVAGQLIGRVGQSGRVTGPHLHWAVRVGDRLVDGTALLALPGPNEGAREQGGR
jgi:murein DD-endopeptidase MepM/ murein hydrolase activator NlpD